MGNFDVHISMECCFENDISQWTVRAEAAEHYRNSADLGNCHDHCHMGRCLENGIGIDKDLHKAVEESKLAVVNGH
jgi:TPR repeat protein